MLPKREVLVRLTKVNTSFLLYGQKSSGKTTLIRSVLNEANASFIQINCTLANKRANFLRLINIELMKYLNKNRPQILNKEKNNDKNNRSNEKINESSKFQLIATPNLDSWINELKRLLNNYPEIIQQLDELYIFMDNIQQMILSEIFLSSFYSACIKEFPFKFNFIFCGINFLKKQYTLQFPFRTMIAFAMPSPIQEYQNIIIKTAICEFKRIAGLKAVSKINEQQIKLCASKLAKQIKAVFQNISISLQKADSITKAAIDAAQSMWDFKDLNRSLLRLINSNGLSDILKKIKQYGPLTQGKISQKMQDQVVEGNNLQYYPNLILSSIHLADYYTEKQDKRRFRDYKNRTYGKNKELKKSDFKVGKHNINRIIAIAQSLESQAKENNKEKIMEHHSLDFYAQFQYLKKINRIKFHASKLTGVVKQEETKAFFKENQLKYEQFMDI